MNVNYTSEKVTEHITRIRDCTSVCMYLIEGEVSALLVDTGYGLGDLRGYVESLTDKPYTVVCTHGHVDHASGAAAFDEVYMSGMDTDLFWRHTTIKERLRFLRDASDAFDCLTEEDFVPQRTKPFLELKDGQEFDLGGLTIRAMHVPGHTAGMMVLLDVEERVAFFGDACGVFTLTVYEESSSVSEYLKSLKRLAEHEDEFDRVLRQHGTCESPKEILRGNIELCEQIIAREDDHMPYDLMGQAVFLAKAVDPVTQRRADGGEGNVVYLDEKI